MQFQLAFLTRRMYDGQNYPPQFLRVQNISKFQNQAPFLPEMDRPYPQPITRILNQVMQSLVDHTGVADLINKIGAPWSNPKPPTRTVCLIRPKTNIEAVCDAGCRYLHLLFAKLSYLPQSILQRCLLLNQVTGRFICQIVSNEPRLQFWPSFSSWHMSRLSVFL